MVQKKCRVGVCTHAGSPDLHSQIQEVFACAPVRASLIASIHMNLPRSSAASEYRRTCSPKMQCVTQIALLFLPLFWVCSDPPLKSPEWQRRTTRSAHPPPTTAGSRHTWMPLYTLPRSHFEMTNKPSPRKDLYQEPFRIICEILV